MGSLFDTLMDDGGNASLDDVFGVAVIYREPAGDTETFTARRVHRAPRVDDEYAGAQVLEFREYLLPADSLTIGGRTIVPKAGAVIVETIAGVDVSFLIGPQGELRAVDDELHQGRYRVRASRQYEA